MGRRKKKIDYSDTAILPVCGGGDAPVLHAPRPLAQPVSATFARVPVQVTAIGAHRVTVAHEKPLAREGDLTLRIPGLFPELSRVGGRVVRRSKTESVIEVTRNPLFLTFAVDAIRHVDDTPRIPIKAGLPALEVEPEPENVLLPPDRERPSLIPIVRLRERPLVAKEEGLLHRLAARVRDFVR